MERDALQNNPGCWSLCICITAFILVPLCVIIIMPDHVLTSCGQSHILVVYVSLRCRI